jgi:hypothetical protein
MGLKRTVPRDADDVATAADSDRAGSSGGQRAWFERGRELSIWRGLLLRQHPRFLNPPVVESGG